MARDLIILSSCSDRKSLPVPESTSLRNVAANSFRELAQIWRKRLKAAVGEHGLAARDLYAGDHWTAVRSIPQLAEKNGWRASVWVCSAGLGVVRSDATVCAYSATFSPGHPDSVPSLDGLSRTEALRAWWRELASKSTLETGPSGLLDAVEDASDPTVLFVGSPAYAVATSSTLLEIRSRLGHSDRLLLITSHLPQSCAELLDNEVRTSAALQVSLGGALSSLHARVARLLATSIPAAKLTVDTANAVLARHAAENPPRTKPVRADSTDDEVAFFIRTRLREDWRSRHTRLLGEWRLRGKKCEQKRFSRLYQEVKESS